MQTWQPLSLPEEKTHAHQSGYTQQPHSNNINVPIVFRTEDPADHKVRSFCKEEQNLLCAIVL
jgi:hypothetical protein